MSLPAQKSHSPVVWVVSFTEDVADRISTEIGHELASLEALPHVVSTALSVVMLACHPADALRNDPQLCAVVFALERAGLEEQAYIDLLSWCITQVARRDDFRLYVFCKDVAPEKLEGIEREESVEVLERLADTVQLNRMTEMGQISRHLRAHVESLQETKREAAWVRLRLATSNALGYVATVAQVICIVSALILVFWLPVWDPDATLRQFAGHEGHVAVICGIAGVPFAVLLLYVYTRYGLVLVRMYEDRLGILYSGVSAFAAPSILSVPLRLNAPFAWILLGLSLGFILEVARRGAYGARRERRAIDPSMIAERHGRLSENLRRQAGPTWINPLRCPLMPVRFPRAFISYARGSAWANKVVEEISERLVAIQASVFRDTDIPEGANWRRALNHHLGRSTVVISLADSVSVERAWPAAEVEAALAGRDLTGLPEMIVIRDPDLPPPSEDTWRWLPVFRETLAPSGVELEVRPQIVDYSEDTAQAVAFKLHPRTYRSVSVVPLKLAELLRALWVVPRVLLMLWGTVGGVAGHTAFVLLFLELIRKFDSAGWLLEHGCFTPSVIGCAAWLGFVVRLALAARFHLRHHRAKGVTAAHRDGGIGLFMLLVLWGWHANPLLIGWALVVAVVSYMAAHEFCAERARTEPSFLRPTD